MKNAYSIELYSADNLENCKMDNSNFTLIAKKDNLNLQEATKLLSERIYSIDFEDNRVEDYGRPMVAIIKDNKQNIDLIATSNFTHPRANRDITYELPDKNSTVINLDKTPTYISHYNEELLNGTLKNAVLKNDKTKAYDACVSGGKVASLKQSDFDKLNLLDQKTIKLELSKALTLNSSSENEKLSKSFNQKM